MTVFVDFLIEYPSTMIKPRARQHGRLWSHLFGTDTGELHLFARGIGIKRKYFQNKIQFPHYDLTPAKRNLAILRGAEQVQLIDFLREQRKRRKL
jgi:hypothetical protein